MSREHQACQVGLTFNIFISNLADDTRRLACDMRWKDVTGTPNERTPILWDFDKLEKWANGNTMKFSKKCKDLHLGWSYPWHGSLPCCKGPVGYNEHQLEYKSTGVLSLLKSMLGCIRRIKDCRSGRLLPLYLVLAIPHGILCPALALPFQ